MTTSSRPTAIGIHIYSGAFTLGVSEYFEILGQWEEGPWGGKTFEMNFPNVPHPMTKAEWPVAEMKARGVNLMYANPPCACWSAVGSHLGVDDPRFQFTLNAAEAAMEVSPDFFILESVPMAWTSGQAAYEEIARRFRDECGMATTIFLTNGLLHYGTQSRNRFHLIAHKKEMNFPEPMIGWRDVPTVRDLIGDLEDSAVYVGSGDELAVPNHIVRRPPDGDLRVMQELKEGEKWNNAANRLTERDGIPAKRGRMIASRLLMDSTVNTVLDIDALTHPTQNRTLTLREGARLCGYPDSFEFAVNTKNDRGLGTNSDVTQAVMPYMGRYLAERCMVSLESDIAKPDGLPMIDFRKIARPFSKKTYLKTKAADLASVAA